MNVINSFRILSFSLISLFSIGLTSCGDDDDDDENKNTQIADTQGKPMARPGVFGLNNKHLDFVVIHNYSTKYSYYESGALMTIRDNNFGYTYSFSEDQETIDTKHDYHSYKNSKEQVSFNRLGFISIIRTVEEADDADVIQTNATYLYDEDGHLLKFGVWDFIWDNGLLFEINNKSYRVQSGSSSYESYTFEYSEKYPNKYQQYVDPMFAFTSRLPRYIALTGYFGKGPSYFPTKVSMQTVKFNNTREGTTTSYATEYTYELNDDGTVASVIAKENGSSSYYSYK